MGVRLIVEVLDHAPEDLTANELLVLLVFAENARDTTRTGWPGHALLAKRARVTPRTVITIVKALVKRDVLVVVRKHSPGRATEYRLAALTGEMASPIETGPQVKSGAVTGEIWGKSQVKSGAVTGEVPTLKSGPLPSVLPSEIQPSSLSSAERIVLGAGVVAEDETRPFVEWIKTNNPQGVTPAWFRHLAKNGDLADWATNYHAAIARGELCAHGRYPWRVTAAGEWVTCPDCPPPELAAVAPPTTREGKALRCSDCNAVLTADDSGWQDPETGAYWCDACYETKDSQEETQHDHRATTRRT